LELADGRALGYDDVGDRSGTPVVYLHGTPDSRLARHPDDGLATRAGVRLLAVDRPGYGRSSPVHALDPGGDLAGRLVALLDALAIDRVGLLAWSGGALAAFEAAAAPALAERVTTLHVVAGIVPRDAYDEPSVRHAGRGRLEMIELADQLPSGELANAVAPLVAPYPCDLPLAAEHQRAQRSDADQAALMRVPGAIEQLARALVEAVRAGLAGVRSDVEAQTRRDAVDLARIRVPVQLWYGSRDTVTPSRFGSWYVERLPEAKLHVIEGAGHYLPCTHWDDLLRALA
jgi:pimeloyl-ACP methyl ester carboxylesterase